MSVETARKWTTVTQPHEARTASNDSAASRFGAPERAEVRTTGEVSADEEKLPAMWEWQLACKVATCKGLSKSDLLPRFLLYVCRESLLGRERQITEQRIGIQIFNRPANYNPGEDNIVRSYARLLRKRLDAYFDGEGSNEPMRIFIPRGGYVPLFQDNLGKRKRTTAHQAANVHSIRTDPTKFADDALTANSLSAADAGQDEKSIPEKQHKNSRARLARSSAWLVGFAGCLAGILLASAGWLGSRALQSRQQWSPAHALWTQMFQRDRNTLIVPADSGLGILENLSKHPVSVEEYANGSYLTEMPLPPGIDEGNFNDLRRQRYTSVVDLNIATRLARLPEVVPTRTQIRYARSISAEDIENSNVILLGSKHTNPWVSLFESSLNFRLDYTPDVDDSYVLNEHPTGKEQKIYRNATGSAPGPTYGVIAYLRGPDGAGHALIIEGLNMAATQAAADALLTPSIIAPVFAQARMRNGSLRPFEVLVQTTSVGATAPGVQIIAMRIHSQ